MGYVKPLESYIFTPFLFSELAGGTNSQLIYYPINEMKLTTKVIM